MKLLQIGWGLLLLAATPASAGTLEDVTARGEIRLVAVAASAPFSETTPEGPRGFAVDLCAAVVDALNADALNAGGAKIRPVWSEMTLAEGLAAIAETRADILCGPVSQTLARRETVDFSIPTFFGGAGFLVRDDAPAGLRRALLEPLPQLTARAMLLELGGMRQVGVLEGSTTAQLLAPIAATLGMHVVVVPSHDAAMSMLVADELQAYAAERTVLLGMLAKAGRTLSATVAPRVLSREPFGLVLRRDDGAFRRVVDAALSRFYRGPGLDQATRRWFGNAAADLISALAAQALPE